MRVIFLDFDGVLNTYSSLYLRTLKYTKQNPIESVACPNPISVGLISKLIEVSNAQIVVSSAWRHGMEVDELRVCLKEEFGLQVLGYNFPPVIGKTAHTRGKEPRGQQILEYLQSRPEIDQYVIIDDSTDMLQQQKKNFVRVDPEIGFSGKNFDKCLKIFKLDWRKYLGED